MLISKMQTLLYDIVGICNTKGLFVNLTKTMYVIFHKPNTTLPDFLPKIIINNCKIERVHEFKYLGVFLDETLNFKHHFDSIKHKISTQVGQILKYKR